MNRILPARLSRRYPLLRWPRLPRLAAACTAGLVAAAGLAGCAPLLVGGAVVGGSMAVVDRRTSGALFDDQAIEFKSVKRVSEVIGNRDAHVSVTSYNRLVLISGEVPTEADKTAVGQAVSRIEGVRSVVNELAIGEPSSFFRRSNDTLITAKVKTSLLDAKDVQANAFKVVTERGIVYLMGRVAEREAARAAEIARGVDGVRKVVRVFEVVTEADLGDLQTKPAPVQP